MRLLKTLLRKLKGVPLLIAIAILIYLLLNIIHFSWFFVSPEGFWSFFKFIGVVSAIIFFTIISVVIIAFLLGFVSSSFSNFPHNFNRKSIFQFLGIIAIFLILIPINYFQGTGFSFYFYNKMADKYSYVKQSEKLYALGAFKNALAEAKNNYDKEYKIINVNKFFFITNYYVNTNYFKQEKLNTQYSALINYADCLKESGIDLNRAEELFISAIDLSNQFITQDKGYEIYPLIGLAEINFARGKYFEAESYNDSLLKIINSRTIGEEDISYIIENQLISAFFYAKVGDFNKSDIIFSQCIKKYESSDLSKKSSDYLTLLLESAKSKMNSGDLDAAGDLLIKAQPIALDKDEREIYLDFLHLKTIYCLNAGTAGKLDLINKSWWQQFVGFFQSDEPLNITFLKEGEKCLIEYCEEIRSRHGEDHYTYASSLRDMASFYSQIGRYDVAKDLYTESLNLIEGKKNDNVDLFYRLLFQSSINDFYAKDYSKLSGNFKQIEDNLFSKLTATFLFLTEEERESFVVNIDKQIRIINATYVNLNEPNISSKIYNNIVAVKGIALYTNNYFRELLLKGDSKNEFNSLMKSREILEQQKKYLQDPKLIEEENNNRIKAKKLLDKLVSQPNFKNFEPQAITWKIIQDSLKDGQIAIEIFNTPSKPYLRDSTKYYALLVGKNYSEPKLVELFDEKELSLILDISGSTKARIESIYVKNQSKLYSCVWKPLEPYLVNSKEVILSVSGILNSVSFASLLSNSEYNYRLVGSTRQIAASRTVNRATQQEAVLFGDIDYSNNGDLSNANYDSVNRQYKYSNLKYAKKELEDIETLLREQNFKTRIFKGKSASKYSFKELNGKDFNILHVASHGSYIADGELWRTPELKKLEDIDVKVDLNPLNRCTLILSGGNSKMKSANVADIKLTALEISKFDLSKLDLVVLSACETGLGEIHGSEGVFGFYRAFKMAGANSTIISLWQVPDESTSKLMVLFYKNYLAGQNKVLALKSAQLELQKSYASPYYWAGFILMD